VTGDDLARVELTNLFQQLLLAACVPALSCAGMIAPHVHGQGVAPAGSTRHLHSNTLETSVGLIRGLAYVRTI
jgi:hypothetical protein